MLRIQKPSHTLQQLNIKSDVICQARLGASVTNFRIYKGYFNYNRSALNSINNFQSQFYPTHGNKQMKVQLSNCTQGIDDTTGIVQYINVDLYENDFYPRKIVTAFFGFGTPVAMLIAGILVGYFCQHWCRCKRIKCKEERDDRNALFISKTI